MWVEQIGKPLILFLIFMMMNKIIYIDYLANVNRIKSNVLIDYASNAHYIMPVMLTTLCQ